MATLSNNMPPGTPNITLASLPAATEYQAIEKSIALPVAKPLIVVIKTYQISPSISLDSTGAPSACLRTALDRSLIEHPPG